jgi:hypothetical protein
VQRYRVDARQDPYAAFNTRSCPARCRWHERRAARSSVTPPPTGLDPVLRRVNVDMTTSTPSGRSGHGTRKSVSRRDRPDNRVPHRRCIGVPISFGSLSRARGSTAPFLIVEGLSSAGRVARRNEGGVRRAKSLPVRVRDGGTTARRRKTSGVADELPGRSGRNGQRVGSLVTVPAELPEVARATSSPRLDARTSAAGVTTGVVPGVVPRAIRSSWL